MQIAVYTNLKLYLNTKLLLGSFKCYLVKFKEWLYFWMIKKKYFAVEQITLLIKTVKKKVCVIAERSVY